MSTKRPCIQDIPIELLAHIFRWFLTIDDDTSYAKFKLPPALLLRSVCRSWHAVAEATPELWADMVGLYGLRWTRRALPLSRHHSLTLYIVLGDGMWQYNRAVKDLDVELPLIMTERHRIATMFINRRRSTNNPLLEPQALLALPMPRLRALAVSCTSSPDMQPLDARIFSGEIPLSLENLELFNCPVRPTCTLLQAPLTHLQIGRCPIWKSLNELLDALSGLPQLETFEWEDLSSEVTLITVSLAFSTKSRYNAVHLPHLRNVTLDTSIEVIAQFFIHVEFPISCSIEANADLTNIPREDLVHVYPALDVAFGKRLCAIFGDGKEHSGFKVLEISPFEDDASNGAVLAWRDPTSLQGPASYHLGFRPGTEDEGHLDSDVLSIINHILDQWPAAHNVVSEVHVRHPGFFVENPEYSDNGSSESSKPSTAASEMQPWSQLLRPLRSVERICAYDAAGRLAESLALRFASSELPHLRYVDIHHTALTSTDVANLINVLKTRECATGGDVSRFPKLRLRKCYLDNVKIADFEVVVS